MVTLIDIDPEVLDVFVDWLYTQRLPQLGGWTSAIKGMGTGKWEVSPRIHAIALAMVKVLVFGDRFSSPKFYRHVNTYLVDWLCALKCPPPYPTVIYAFEHLPSEKSILQLLAELQYLHWRPYMDTDEAQKLYDRLPQEFLLRVMKKLGSSFEADVNVCKYHEHADGIERARCKGNKREWEQQATAQR